MNADKLFISAWLTFIGTWVVVKLYSLVFGFSYVLPAAQAVAGVVVVYVFLKNKPKLNPSRKAIVLWDVGRFAFNRVAQFMLAVPLLLTPSWFWDMTWNGAYVFDNTLGYTFGMMVPETGYYLPAAPEFLLMIMKMWYAFGVVSLLFVDFLILLKYRHAIRLRFLALLTTVVMTIPGLYLEFLAGHLGPTDAVGIAFCPFITFLILTRTKQT